MSSMQIKSSRFAFTVRGRSVRAPYRLSLQERKVVTCAGTHGRAIGEPALEERKFELAKLKPSTEYAESAVVSAIRRIPRKVYRHLQSFIKEDVNPYMQGALAPVETEVFTTNLEVEGAVPPELNGMYMRTGPNPQHEPYGGYHWFDGEAMVHAVRFQDGAALSYTNHWLRVNRLMFECAAGENVWPRIGDLRGGLGLVLLLLYRAFYPLLCPAAPDFENNQQGNTALTFHNGRLLALMEGSVPFCLHVAADGRVSSGGSFRFGGALTHELMAHPKVDPRTGEMLLFVSRLYPSPTRPLVSFVRASPSGQLSREFPVDVSRAQMMHDFAITANFAVFLDHALVFDPATMVAKGSMPFAVDRATPSRIGLLRRDAPEAGVRWFAVPPFVCFHTINAWEEDGGDTVQLSIVKFDYLELGSLQHSAEYPAQPTRYTLHIPSGSVSETPLLSGADTARWAIEHPVVPPDCVGRPHQFCYVAAHLRSSGCDTTGRPGPSTAAASDGADFNGVAKIDLTARMGQGLVGTIMHPPGHVGGEFSFVPRQRREAGAEGGGAHGGVADVEGRAEDDGYLVGYVTDKATMESYCMVYDAKTMDTTPVAKVVLPQRVPLGFHGTFLTEPQLSVLAKQQLEQQLEQELVDAPAVPRELELPASRG